MLDKLPDVFIMFVFCLGGILALVLLVIIIKKLVGVIQKIDYNRKVAYVKKYSKKIKLIEELNHRYSKTFFSLKPFYGCNHSNKSKTAFDKTDYHKLFLQYLNDNSKYINDCITLAEHNRAQYCEYLSEYDAIVSIDSVDYQRKNNNSDKLLEIEANCCEKIKYNPICSVTIRVFSYYMSPKRQNCYSNYRFFYERDIQKGFDELERIENKKLSVQYQRSLMTDSLRYDILQRDCFRCVLCGASQEDGVKLEVDYIVPVSKGGKTEWDNLRTLCDRCNGGKSDKYDPKKMN